ncbi:hypothetical protein NEMIN01_0574 [Nematocida minor]|uniref:uncharacterized protein n=1 Tax=Nematocida minor TaxID=1912983 RepID=UPI0022201F53|nr:uncharacterized protein NEMIN01_0574 [Nematocida minor]KAI5189621.1 hypothetical protein NEMIN01_0574 [Nematocida minor]
MKLLPIRARATEGSPQACELFFIDRTKFSSEYFSKSVLPLLPGIDKEEYESQIETPAIRMHTDIATQVTKYTADIEKFAHLYRSAKINLHIDFKVPNYLWIEDRVCFTLPIKNEPEIYAKDLFRVYSIPEGELFVIFSFYLRENILGYIKECIVNKEVPDKPDFQQEQPLVHTSEIDKLNQSLLSYESFGRVVVLKEIVERKRKKKQYTANMPSPHSPIFGK